MSDLPPPPQPPTGDVDWATPEGVRPDAPYGVARPRKGIATLEEGRPVELAGRGARLGARLIDLLVVVVGMLLSGGVGVIVLWYAGASSDDSLGAVALTSVALSVFGYEVAFTAIKGQTFGKMAAGIRVVRADNGRNPGWGKALGRWAVPFCVNLVPLFGQLACLLVYASLTWNPNRQGWHDRAAGTLVVKA